jgi:hypothetical protein
LAVIIGVQFSCVALIISKRTSQRRERYVGTKQPNAIRIAINACYCYERFLDQKIVVSRIASIQTSSIGGQQYIKIITKNDNSDWKAQDSVIAENYIGKVVYTIPHVAQIFEVLTTQLDMVIIIGTPLAIILLYYYGKKKKRIKCEKRSAP